MKNLKSLFLTLTIATFIGCAAVDAQNSDSSTSTAITSSNAAGNTLVSDPAAQPTHRGSYLWVTVAAIVGIGVVGGVIISQRKKGDVRPQTGGDINNPASGI